MELLLGSIKRDFQYCTMPQKETMRHIDKNVTIKKNLINIKHFKNFIET